MAKKSAVFFEGSLQQIMVKMGSCLREPQNNDLYQGIGALIEIVNCVGSF